MRGASLLVFATCALFSAAPLSACINTFDGQIISSLRNGERGTAEGIVGSLEKKYDDAPTLENRNDFGVGLLLIGKLDAAIKLFRDTESKFPGNAKVASNLGTALELKGNNDEALKWIRESVIRDPAEHYGSEWLHARILQAKIKYAIDPKWLEENRVLEIDFGQDEVPVAPAILPFEKGKLKGAAQLHNQILFQLFERKKFIQPPDPIFGDLAASAGDLAIAGSLSPLDGGNQDPLWSYEEALKFGAPHADLIRKRMARYQADLAALPPQTAKDEVVDYPAVGSAVKPRSVSGTLLIPVALAIVILLGLLGFAVWMIRARRKAGTN